MSKVIHIFAAVSTFSLMVLAIIEFMNGNLMAAAISLTYGFLVAVWAAFRSWELYREKQNYPVKWHGDAGNFIGTIAGFEVCNVYHSATVANCEYYRATCRRFPWQHWRDVGECNTPEAAAQLAEWCR